MRRLVASGTALSAVAGWVLGIAVLTAAPASAELSGACIDTDDGVSARPGAPLKDLRIPDVDRWLAAHGKAPAGTGVVVAVVDSGVADVPAIPQQALQVNLATRPEVTYYHGTAVAGIINGAPDVDGTPIGIAPAASILDVKVYDAPTAEEEGDTLLTAATVSTGLTQVLAQKKAGMNIKVVNLSVNVDDSPDLKILVNQLWKAGVVVVASSGNRSFVEDDPLAERFGTYEAGENAADYVFPAGYDRALAVSSTVGGLPDADPLAYVLQNTATDVAVPTSGAPTYSLLGTTCTLHSPATSWAAAEVSGVLALLASTYPDETPGQLVARLENTANGREDVRNPLTGAGVVQPYEALTRPMTIGADGSFVQTTPVQAQQRAELPPPTTDPLGSTRDDMVWYGVIGGGVLVLALVLRPVLARRRPG